MCASEPQEHRERPRASSPGLQLLAYLEGLRVEAEAQGADLDVELLNLPHICADLGLAGLVAWRAHHDDVRIEWQLESRETLIWHQVGRLFSCYASVDWMHFCGQADRDPEAG
jgi:hypothetical protein